MDGIGDGIVSELKKELEANVTDALENMAKASGALRQYQLNEAYDDGFEAGVISQENGLGRE